jgi:hypothetical protein
MDERIKYNLHITSYNCQFKVGGSQLKAFSS